VTHDFNTRTEEAEAGGSCVQSQPGICSESLSQKKKNHTDSGWALNPMTGNFIRSGEENREAQERRQCKNGNRN
jgi:hypothetical protein